MYRQQRGYNNSTILRHVEPGELAVVKNIQTELVAKLQNDHETSMTIQHLPHLTVAKGRRDNPRLTDTENSVLLNSVPRSAHAELELPVARVTLLGRTLGKSALCLLFNDPDHILQREHNFFRREFYKARPLDDARPHLTLGTIAARDATVDLLDFVEMLSPDTMTFEPPVLNPGRLPLPHPHAKQASEPIVQPRIPTVFLQSLEIARQAR